MNTTKELISDFVCVYLSDYESIDRKMEKQYRLKNKVWKWNSYSFFSGISKKCFHKF